MMELIQRLYPICRSITGNGVRETLRIIGEHIPIQIHEVPTGTKVFDWTVPKEWNVKDAYVKNSKGERVIDFQKSNLHVVNYSVPVRARMRLNELKKHLHSLPEHPEWIPYLTSYYKELWGFCLPHRELLALPDDEYEVMIDSTLEPGSLTYGELVIPGKRREEFLLSCYICHPSMCNDNLSGTALVTAIAKALRATAPNEYTYRFLFIPETIGSITWLARNESIVPNIKFGLVVTCVGDRGPFTYRKSRQDTAVIDKAVEKALVDAGAPHRIIDFFVPGSDERQFGSLAFQMPVGSLMRTAYDRYPEYHTSADSLDFVDPISLGDSFRRYMDVIGIIEHDKTYINTNPKCEPQLGKRGVYSLLGGQKNVTVSINAMTCLLNLCDGTQSLLEVAIRSGMLFSDIKAAAELLVEVGILKETEPS